MDLECPQFTSYLPPLVFSPNGRTVATSDTNNTVRLWDVATGQELPGLEGHCGLVTSLSFSADGKRLISGSEDTSVLIWDLSRLPKNNPRASVPLSPKELEALWADLSGGDAARAYQAAAKLLTAPKQTVAFLQDRLRVKPPPDVKGIPGLLDDLDADDFTVREKAATEFEKLGEAAQPALEKALKGQPSIEVKRRIQELLEKLRESPVRLQALRALEVLEHIDTAESRQLLARLADGASDAWLTKEAKAIDRRLAGKQH
jgi:hypothetical protein